MTAEHEPVTSDQAGVGEPGRPLRVAMFTDNYGPGHSGLLYAVQFLEGELLARGWHVQVVAPKCDGPNPYASHPHRSELRLPAIKVPGLPMVIGSGVGFEAALDKLAADPPDVIHVHGLGTVGLLGVWAADRLNLPLMVTWHTDFEAYADHYALFTPFADAYYRVLKLATNGMQRPSLQGLRRYLTPRWWRRGGISRRNLLNAAKEMMEAADLVTAPSDKTAMRCRELAPAAHIRVVPNGADALPPAEPLPPTRGPRILYVGRIAPEKNIGLLLEAFGWVREEIPNAELMIVGDWRAGGLLQQKLKRARNRGGVTLVGQVPRTKLYPYYASADVFAFPSTTDTQALVLHEAAHAGLPIVSCDHELRLVIDEGVNGAIARPTPESFARQLVMLLHQLEDPRFRTRAHERSREMASWWTIAYQSDSIMELYRDLAARRPIEERMKAVPPVRVPDADLAPSTETDAAPATEGQATE